MSALHNSKLFCSFLLYRWRLFLGGEVGVVLLEKEYVYDRMVIEIDKSVYNVT